MLFILIGQHGGVPYHHIRCIEIVFILMTNLNNAKLKQFELHCIDLDA